MMKQGVAMIALAIAALPAAAQDAGEIARVKAGEACSGCNLFQANLAYRDLEGIDVSGARLRQADLKLSTLDRANLSGADLSIANLFGARLTGARLREADLSRATLVGTYLGGADLAGATLAGANLSGADLRTAKGLTQAQLSGACGDASTRLPVGLSLQSCNTVTQKPTR